MNERDADVIAMAIHTATAPLLAKIAMLEARPTVAPDVLEFLKDNAADLRQRMIAVEARALVPGPKGDNGRDGIDAKGIDGIDGSSFMAGIGPPTTDARIGDVYLDAQNGDVYQWR